MTSKTDTVNGAADSARHAPPSDRMRERSLFRLREALRGTLYMGISFLLGSCKILFGTLPLGIAFLCASSSHSWYIFAGLIISAIVSASAYPTWLLLVIYSLALLLRFGMLFLIDSPPDSDKFDRSGNIKKDKYSVHRDIGYLMLCWKTFKKLLPSAKTKYQEDERADYYPGSMFSKNPPQPIDDTEADSTSDSSACLFGENIFLRMLTGCICGFFLGLAAMIRGGFQFYDLFGTLFLIVSVPMITFMFAPVFSYDGEKLLFIREAQPHEQEHQQIRYTAFSTISVSILLFFTIYAARSYSISIASPILTLYIAPSLAILLTFIISKRLGFVSGIIASVVVGLAADPILSPVFVLGAVAFTLVRPVSPKACVVCGSIAGLAWCYFYGGVLQLITLAPSILIAIPLFFITEKIKTHFPIQDEFSDSSMSDFAAAVTSQTRSHASRARLGSLSDAFSSLSELFYGLSTQLRRPRISELQKMCCCIFDKHCANCPRRNICRVPNDDRTRNTIVSVSTQLHSRGHIESDDLPLDLRENCPNLNFMVQEINTGCAQMTAALMRSEKTEVVAADYEAMSTMLRDALKDDSEEYRSNREAADRIYDYLTSLGIRIQGVVVCGKRSCRVIVRGIGFERVSKKADEIKAELERICNTKLSAPAFEKENDHTIMFLSSVARISTSYSGSTVPSDRTRDADLYRSLTDDPKTHRSYAPASPCGDHIALFTNDHAYFYALISDGMGSGEEASFTSNICTVFLEKMLTAGNRTEISLRMLNSIIRSKNSSSGEECSATVDLMELDLINGQATFAKNGAAPTYVVRGGTVYKLRSRNMPIGILKDNDTRFLRFRMHPGDVIVMVSDGVTHGNDECPWLIDLLSDPLPNSMDSLRLDILRRAIASGSPDDLSAIAVRVDNSHDPDK